MRQLSLKPEKQETWRARRTALCLVSRARSERLRGAEAAGRQAGAAVVPRDAVTELGRASQSDAQPELSCDFRDIWGDARAAHLLKWTLETLKRLMKGIWIYFLLTKAHLKNTIPTSLQHLQFNPVYKAQPCLWSAERLHARTYGRLWAFTRSKFIGDCVLNKPRALQDKKQHPRSLV